MVLRATRGVNSNEQDTIVDLYIRSKEIETWEFFKIVSLDKKKNIIKGMPYLLNPTLGAWETIVNHQ